MYRLRTIPLTHYSLVQYRATKVLVMLRLPHRWDISIFLMKLTGQRHDANQSMPNSMRQISILAPRIGDDVRTLSSQNNTGL